MKISIVLGTRPEIIKFSPIIRECERLGLDYFLLHTGQHYSYNMDKVFFEHLEIPMAKYNLDVGSGSDAKQIGKMLIGLEKVFRKEMPDVVLVEGDTNSVLAGALAATKLNIKVGHVEAGLRSYDLRMPEEHNRRLTDHMSEFLFAPTVSAQTNLKKENVWGKIYVTGNTIIDAAFQHLPIAEKKSKILEKILFKKFVLATAHRAENVDDLSVLKNFIDAFAEAPLPVVYTMHPRTKKRLRQNGLYTKVKRLGNVQILPPLSYFDFLVLMRESELVITDSGGIQEEATAPCIRKSVVVIRISTERPEAVETGFAKVVGTKKRDILAAIATLLDNRGKLPEASPFGDGHAAKKIVETIQKEFHSNHPVLNMEKYC